MEACDAAKMLPKHHARDVCEGNKPNTDENIIHGYAKVVFLIVLLVILVVKVPACCLYPHRDGSADQTPCEQGESTGAQKDGHNSDTRIVLRVASHKGSQLKDTPQSSVCMYVVVVVVVVVSGR